MTLLFFKYVEANKSSGMDWFRLESNAEGTKWFGKCWYVHELLKYEFEVEFDVRILSLFEFICLVNYFGIFSCFSKDSSDLSYNSAGNSATGIGRKNCQNVSRRKDLSNGPL